LKCWGNNYFGQLGRGDTANRGDESGEMGDALSPISLGAGLKALGVSAGASHTCAVLTGGSVKCWGSKESGQLGQENNADLLSPKDLAPVRLKSNATAVSASNYLFAGKGGKYGGATCALLDNGSVQCWGATDGVPHTSSADSDNSYGIGDAAGEMSALSPLTFSGGQRAKSIVAQAVSAAILDDGSLRLWGSGPHLGQPQLGADRVGMTPTALANLSAVDMGGKKVKSIAVGKAHACAVVDGGGLKCWGSGDYGQLGLGSTSSTNAAPSTLPSVELGGSAALQVATGETHTCAILGNGTLKCWGDNSNGQLGLGHTERRGDSGGRLSADTTVDLAF
jgi:alpha-tubulin suppressor-like RCC1 family protein